MNRLDQLLLLWEEDRLAEEEYQELKNLLASPEARRQVVDNFITAEIIRKVLAGETCGNDEEVIPFQEDGGLVAFPNQPSQFRRLTRRCLAIAAIVLLLIGLIRMLAPASGEELRVLQVRGAAWVTRGAGRFPLRGNITHVRTGDMIDVGENALVELSYPDGTQLSFSSETQVALSLPRTGHVGKSVFLKRGSLAAQVTKQPEGNPMIFDTAQARATVLGTRLTLRADSKFTRLDVSEGRVELTRQQDGTSVQVSKGEHAIADSDPVGILFRETFEDGDLAGRGWYDNTSIATAPGGATLGSARAVEYHFIPGADTAISGGPLRRLFRETDSVYVSYWVKYSENYVGAKSKTSTPEISLMTNADERWAGASFNHLTAYVKQQDGVPFLALQDGKNVNVARVGQDLIGVTEDRAVAGGNGVLPIEQASSVAWYPIGRGLYRNVKEFRVGQGTPDRPYYTSGWHRVELYLKMNTITAGIGQPDGVMKFWLDGNLSLERNSVLMRTGKHPEMKFNQLVIAPFMEQGSPVDQTLWIDEVALGTAPPP